MFGARRASSSLRRPLPPQEAPPRAQSARAGSTSARWRCFPCREFSAPPRRWRSARNSGWPSRARVTRPCARVRRPSSALPPAQAAGSWYGGRGPASLIGKGRRAGCVRHRAQKPGGRASRGDKRCSPLRLIIFRMFLSNQLRISCPLAIVPEVLGDVLGILLTQRRQ